MKYYSILKEAYMWLITLSKKTVVSLLIGVLGVAPVVYLGVRGYYSHLSEEQQDRRLMHEILNETKEIRTEMDSSNSIRDREFKQLKQEVFDLRLEDAHADVERKIIIEQVARTNSDILEEIRVSNEIQQGYLNLLSKKKVETHSIYQLASEE